MSSPSPTMVSLSRRAAVLLAVLMPVAAADDAPLCRIKIGDDWVTMGAESQASCLKFAQSAALPDERQLSEFGGQQFAYEDGRLSTTRDGGRTWVDLSVEQDTVDPMQSLNVLRDAGHGERMQRLHEQRAKPADEHRCICMHSSNRSIFSEPARCSRLHELHHSRLTVWSGDSVAQRLAEVLAHSVNRVIDGRMRQLHTFIVPS